MTLIKQYFASTEEEAVSRYEEYKSNDPFPNIPSALLSSAQIQAYIAKTGMVFPYFPAENPKEERVTSASLTMTIGSEVLYWDSEDKQQYKKNLAKDGSITLRPNSITFLRPAERFNMPDYIAARFNLRIVHVHRGLLLGTGPLMDPGFKGYPMIPVHNLTENEYIVRPGEDFINVEFTKVNCDSNYELTGQDGKSAFPFTYLPNRGKTFDFSFINYIDKNVPQRKVKSSLSAVIDQAREAVRQQKEQAERAKDKAEEDVLRQKVYAWISIVAAIISIAALVYGGYQLTVASIGIIDDARTRMDQYAKQQERLTQLEGMVHGLQKQIEDFKVSIADSVGDPNKSAQRPGNISGTPKDQPTKRKDSRRP